MSFGLNYLPKDLNTTENYSRFLTYRTLSQSGSLLQTAPPCFVVIYIERGCEPDCALAIWFCNSYHRQYNPLKSEAPARK